MPALRRLNKQNIPGARKVLPGLRTFVKPWIRPVHHGLEALEHYERYQSLVAEPSGQVAGWIIDLRRRLGVPEEDSARVAQEDAP